MGPVQAMTHPDVETIGLVAGWGRFPILVARELKRSGYKVVCCGIKGHAAPELIDICDEFRWFGLAKLGAQLRYFQSHQTSKATMAGKIFKTLLLEKFHLLKHLPDLKSLRHFYSIYFSKTKNRNDDTLLLTVTELFASGGVDFLPATDFAPKLLVHEGPLTRRLPNHDQLKDIDFAWNLAKEMGRLDIGQSVAVKDRAVVAIEAVEGTDACIRRAGELCKAGDIVIAKVAKPQQDMRFDVPTVGTSTLDTMKKSGASILAIEAEKTILLDKPDFIRKANELDICVVSLLEPNTNRKIAA
ncbi:MAG: UDP-2,3-diacylglucosamine diphosphatase LpxI [Planctomycetota bacterium]